MSHLLDHHRDLIAASAIKPEVAKARGYFSAERKAHLGELGFGRAQQLVPALVVPIRDVRGEVAMYLARPDQPRMVKGRPAKYEFPSGCRMRLDVPLKARESLGDPTIPLWITEGARKADAAVSVGLACISLIGTFNWRGTNEAGGKTALPDWEHVALNDREVYVCFDSDVMTKPAVYAALARLRELVKSRGAKVRLVYLPSGEGGVKVGLDDYIAAGHGIDDLLALVTTELRQPPRDPNRPHAPYAERDGQIVELRQVAGQMGPEIVESPLTNFTCRIAADVTLDDGIESQRRFELEAEIRGRSVQVPVPASQFNRLEWVSELLGADAIVHAGQATRDKARAAIQLLSGEVSRRKVFSHAGWREVDGVPCYLHAGGAIGAEGPVQDVEVELSGALEHFALPMPPEGSALREAVRASLATLDLAPMRLTVPLLAAVYRAPLGEADLGLHLHGPTGAGKSELAALCQQHFGQALDARHLPGSWSSTANALEGLLCAAKDTIVVVDDFAPAGSKYDVERYHGAADRVFRAQGNRTSRDRMNRDGTLRPPRPPRSLIVATGEEIPRGASLRARLMPLAVRPGDVDFDALSAAQSAGARGRYAQALAGYARYLAGQYEDVRAAMAGRLAELRQHADRSGGHRRTPAIVASLALGWEHLLAFAQGCDAIDVGERESLWAAGWKALGEAAEEQSLTQAAADPAQRFLELLASALASGGAHAATVEGGEPDWPTAWGWRHHLVGAGDHTRPEWRPQGTRVGWVDGDALYLDPDAAYDAAQRAARESGDRLMLDPGTLRQRLHERGLLVSTDEARGRLTVRKRGLEGCRRQVLHLRADALQPDKEGSEVTDPGGTRPDPSRPSVAPGAPVVQHRWVRGGSVVGPSADPARARSGSGAEGGGSGGSITPDDVAGSGVTHTQEKLPEPLPVCVSPEPTGQPPAGTDPPDPPDPAVPADLSPERAAEYARLGIQIDGDNPAADSPQCYVSTEQLQRLEAEGAPPHIVALLTEVVGSCPVCGRYVRRCDSRRLTPGPHERLGHLWCVDPQAWEEIQPRLERPDEDGNQ